MKKERLTFAIGIWIAILPFLGFPGSWKDVLIFLSGLVVIFIAYLFYRKNKREGNKPDSFTDNLDEL